MALVRVPDRMKEFQTWIREVTKSAELHFDRRAKGKKSSSSKSKNKRRKRRRKKRTHGSRD